MPDGEAAALVAAPAGPTPELAKTAPTPLAATLLAMTETNSSGVNACPGVGASSRPRPRAHPNRTLMKLSLCFASWLAQSGVLPPCRGRRSLQRGSGALERVTTRAGSRAIEQAVL